MGKEERRATRRSRDLPAPCEILPRLKTPKRPALLPRAALGSGPAGWCVRTRRGLGAFGEPGWGVLASRAPSHKGRGRPGSSAGAGAKRGKVPGCPHSGEIGAESGRLDAGGERWRGPRGYSVVLRPRRALWASVCGRGRRAPRIPRARDCGTGEVGAPLRALQAERNQEHFDPRGPRDL